MGAKKKNDYPLPTIQIDTREKQPFEFRASATLEGYEIAKIDCGDYIIKGHEDLICVERKKSIVELCGNFGKHRDRFNAELERMQVYKFKYIVIEDSWSAVFAYKKFTKMNVNAVFQSILSFALLYGVHFVFAHNRKNAQTITRGLLVKAYKYRMEGKV